MLTIVLLGPDNSVGKKLTDSLCPFIYIYMWKKLSKIKLKRKLKTSSEYNFSKINKKEKSFYKDYIIIIMRSNKILYKDIK